jgi:hypothetical protein
MRNSVKYNKTKYIDTNSLRSKLLTRRTLSIAGSNRSGIDNS